MKGDPAHSIWYWAGIVVTVIIAYITGNIFVKNEIISRNYSLVMIILPVLLGLTALILMR